MHMGARRDVGTGAADRGAELGYDSTAFKASERDLVAGRNWIARDERAEVEHLTDCERLERDPDRVGGGEAAAPCLSSSCSPQSPSNRRGLLPQMMAPGSGPELIILAIDLIVRAMSFSPERIAFVLLPRFPLSSLVPAIEGLRLANQNSGQPLYDWRLLSSRRPRADRRRLGDVRAWWAAFRRTSEPSLRMWRRGARLSRATAASGMAAPASATLALVGSRGGSVSDWDSAERLLCPVLSRWETILTAG